jgi:hypothetical protein
MPPLVSSSACSLNVISRTNALMLFPVAKAMPAPFSRRRCLTSWTLIHSSEPSMGPGSFGGAGGCWVTGAESSTIVERCATWKGTWISYQYWGRFLTAAPEKLWRVIITMLSGTAVHTNDPLGGSMQICYFAKHQIWNNIILVRRKNRLGQ